MNKVSKAIRLTKIAISDAFDPKSVFGVNKVRAVMYGFLGYLKISTNPGLSLKFLHQ